MASEVNQIVTTIEVQKVIKPIWCTAKSAHELFGIPPMWLNSLAKEGKLRTKKLGDAKQATRLYRVADLEEWLEGEG